MRSPTTEEKFKSITTRYDRKEMIDTDLNNPFWQYSLKVYAQPGVADTCLQLQDQYGCNINLLLLAAWAGSQGFQLSPSDFVELQERIRQFDQQTIQPLRNLRRQVSQPSALPQEWQTELKQRLLSAELLAEQVEQALLYDALLPRLKKRGNTFSSSVQDNLSAYISAINQPAQPDSLTLIRRLAQLST